MAYKNNFFLLLSVKIFFSFLCSSGLWDYLPYFIMVIILCNRCSKDSPTHTYWNKPQQCNKCGLLFVPIGPPTPRPLSQAQPVQPQSPSQPAPAQPQLTRRPSIDLNRIPPPDKWWVIKLLISYFKKKSLIF